MYCPFNSVDESASKYPGKQVDKRFSKHRPNILILIASNSDITVVLTDRSLELGLLFFVFLIRLYHKADFSIILNIFVSRLYSGPQENVSVFIIV